MTFSRRVGSSTWCQKQSYFVIPLRKLWGV